tara:strand:- start:1217 stop:1669 length:453 start_codon:yes stop_codon:yes gene_type:complete
MKPQINEVLLNLAQEIIYKFSPALNNEYDKSRLGSWGAISLIAALQFDNVANALYEENRLINDWLNDNLGLFSDELIEEVKQTKNNPKDLKVSTLDSLNQRYRSIMVKAHIELENGRKVHVLLSSINILKQMHSNRKVSNLLDLLAEGTN